MFSCGLWRKLGIGAAGLVTAGVGTALVMAGTKSHPADDHQRVPVLAERGTVLPSSDEGPPTPQESRLAAVDRAWAAFDGLRGPQFRTKEMLLAHLLQANQVADGLPAVEHEALIEHNEEQYRKRLPALLVVGEQGLALGAGFRRLSPAVDPDRCAELGKAWFAGSMRATLAQAGFLEMVCVNSAGAVTQFWKLPE